MAHIDMTMADVEWSAILPSEKTLDLASDSNVFWPIYFALLLLTAMGVWATFVKAGRRGWTCLIPIYNVVVLFKIVHHHPLWALLFLVPGVNIALACWVTVRLAEHFGKGVLFGAGLSFLPFLFYPMIGFGSATYRHPCAVLADAKAAKRRAQNSRGTFIAKRDEPDRVGCPVTA